ncbi:MAG: hypothetical protein H6719_21415 [Sandaracinaceae bacterium]|nr:hypothetical protein [Sandaracinaceae bacterium]
MLRRTVLLSSLLTVACSGGSSAANDPPLPHMAPAAAPTESAEPTETDEEPAVAAGISCPDYNLGGTSFDSGWSQLTGCSDSTVRWLDCTQGRCECKTGPDGVDLYGPEIQTERAFEPTGAFPPDLGGWLQLMREGCGWNMAQP